MDVVLRKLTEADLDLLFDWMRDPAAVRMAAFTAEDPDDRQRFDGWAARVRGDERNVLLAIEADGAFAGVVGSYPSEGDREVTYWIAPDRWGGGIASAALHAFLALERHRPLIGRTAEGNAASAAVLTRNGFREVGTATGFAAGVGHDVLEHVHRLDVRTEVGVFDDPVVPEGASAYVDGAAPSTDVRIVEPDPAWPAQARALIARIRAALPGGVVRLEHVGSTAVAGLPAKAVLDLCLVVPDPDDEAAYVPRLTAEGFRLAVREPWWYRHRLLRLDAPRTNLHVFGPESAEAARMSLFRDHLRTHPEDRDRYAAAKRDAAADAVAAGEHVQQYNARKERVVRDVYSHLFAERGLR